MSGVAAAEKLISGLLQGGKSPEVHLFDRGRVVGGRCSSRHVDVDGYHIEFNHGCQIICPRTDEFLQHVDQVWRRELGLVRQCPQVIQLDSFGRQLHPASSQMNSVENFMGHGRGRDVFVGTPDMNAIVSGVAHQCHSRYPGFSINANTAVTDIRRVGTASWRVTYGGGECKYFTHIVVADAAAVDLVQHPDTPAAVRDGFKAVTSVEYEPVFAFVAATQGSQGSITFSNAILDHQNTTETTPLTPFSMISRQQQLESHDTWVALTTQRKAREILQRWPMRTATGTVIPQDGEYRKKVAEYLAPDFKQALQYLAGIDQPRMENVVVLWTFSHRWGRAFPTRDTVLSTPSIYMEEYGIGACGDAFHSPPASPLESAWLSGRHLGNQILKQVL
ncbi:hypothetical protein M9435_002444 [Picochlorum sp. BPE23]|nr:hypothetical protein M9435_002444 [Picochlorum sp. BPE23]